MPGTVTDSEVNEEPGRDPGLRGCESLRSPQGRAVHWRDKRPVKPWLRLWEFESLPAHSRYPPKRALVVQRTARWIPNPQEAGSTPAESTNRYNFSMASYVRTWTDEQLTKAIAEEHSWRAVARSLGMKSTSSWAIVHRRTEELGLDTSHFVENAAGQKKSSPKP